MRFVPKSDLAQGGESDNIRSLKGGFCGKGVQRRAAAEQSRIIGAEGLARRTAALRLPTASPRSATRLNVGFTNYAVRWFECRMPRCAEPEAGPTRTASNGAGAHAACRIPCRFISTASTTL